LAYVEEAKDLEARKSNVRRSRIALWFFVGIYGECRGNI
jgi:hypothetical protein